MIKRFELLNGTLAAAESTSARVHFFVDPTPDERKLLLRSLEMDEHALASALDPDEVSRVEFEPGRIFLIWKLPTNYSGADTFFFDVASIGFLLTNESLTVISTREEDFSKPAARFKPAPSTLLDLLIAFLLGSVHHYTAHLRTIKMIARELERKISMSMENKHLLQMFNLSESLVYYLNAINGNGVVISRLRTYAEKHKYPEDVLELLDDLAIENNQCYKQAEIYSTILSGLMDARGNLINNNMNVLLKKLTIINVVFLPLNLIASMGGMSEYSMVTSAIDWRISYGLFSLAMVGIGWATAVIVKRIGNDHSTAKTTATKSTSK